MHTRPTSPDRFATVLLLAPVKRVMAPIDVPSQSKPLRRQEDRRAVVDLDLNGAASLTIIGLGRLLAGLAGVAARQPLEGASG